MDRERNLRIRANKLRLRRIRDASDPFALPDKILQGLYRVNIDLARTLIEELWPFMHVPRRSTAVPPEIKVDAMYTIAKHVKIFNAYLRKA